MKATAALIAMAGSPKEIYEPESYKQWQNLSPDFAPKELKEPYDKTAPDPSHWPVLVKKIKDMARDFNGYPAADLNRIRAQVLIMMGDRDVVRPEHAVEMYRLIPIRSSPSSPTAIISSSGSTPSGC